MFVKYRWTHPATLSVIFITSYCFWVRFQCSQCELCGVFVICPYPIVIVIYYCIKSYTKDQQIKATDLLPVSVARIQSQLSWCLWHHKVAVKLLPARSHLRELRSSLALEQIPIVSATHKTTASSLRIKALRKNEKGQARWKSGYVWIPISGMTHTVTFAIFCLLEKSH